MLALIPSGAQKDQLLQDLAATRILSQRLAASPEEVWQLYHDYLADAIVALDRRKRKWHLLLSDAAERFRLSDGPVKKLALLLSPFIQLKLLWHRFKGQDFRYGEYTWFAGLSAIRLLINPWTLSLAIGVWAWTFWQETREVQEIMDSFHQGGGHEEKNTTHFGVSPIPAETERNGPLSWVFFRHRTTRTYSKKIRRQSKLLLVCG